MGLSLEGLAIMLHRTVYAMNWQRFFRRIGGTAIFIVGVVALALPIIPGLLLIAFGLYLLAVDSPGMQTRITVLRTRHAYLDRFLAPVDRLLGHATTEPEEHREV